MEKIKKTEVISGVFWIEIPEAEVYILCGNPEDAVKHLMLRGLICQVEKNGVVFESGPNAILLSDVPVQNGCFSNLAEFPVLQMLYRQGMIIPGHPNNTGIKPLLLGSKEQIDAQMRYIYRGNYGLTSVAEIMAAGETRESAEEIMRTKLKFAFGTIRATEQLLDHRVVESTPVEIRNGAHIRRLAVNQFEISFAGETTTVNLNLRKGEHYRSPYPLGFQDIPRDYFAVVHSGQGDGWDTNRPSMASIIIFQGRIYLVDAGPNIAYSLTALGIGVNEIEGVFHTHCHDDHFAGLTTLIRADHRIKYFATPLVRASVFKKLSAVLSIDEELIEGYFDIHDLEFDVWNDFEGLEVRPLMSPHPVETSVFFFRTFWDSRYITYAHLSDITSMAVLRDMIAGPEDSMGITGEFFERIRKEYLCKVELKKIDIGGGLIHGEAEDFEADSSDKIILAHRSRPLLPHHKEIGSSAPFGVVDVLIPDQSDNLRRFAFEFLRAYFPTMGRHYLRTLLNCPIVDFMPGNIILKKGEVNANIHLVLTGNMEKINSEEGIYNLITAGGLIGEHSGMHGLRSRSTYRTISYVRALRLPAELYTEFVKQSDLYGKIERLHENREFLERTWLFGESISPSVQNRIAEAMVAHQFEDDSGLAARLDPTALYLVKSGDVSLAAKGREQEALEPGSFFGEDRVLFGVDRQRVVHTTGPASLFEVPGDSLADIPIVMWKLLETYEKRIT